LLLGTSTESAASDMGSAPAFPSLVFSILRAAAAPHEPVSYDLGQAVETGLAPETSVTITDPVGHNAQAQARDLMQRPLNVFREAGIYRLESEKGVRFVALNTPGVESERALAEGDEVQHYFAETKPVATAGGSEWREAAEHDGNTWRYFLGAAFLLLFTELLVRVRRSRKSTSHHARLGHEQ
jgi:hypothetical protein